MSRSAARAPLFPLLLAAVACQGVTHSLGDNADATPSGNRDASAGGTSGDATTPASNDASVHTGPLVQVDILFVVRNAGSMTAQEATLVQSLGAFADALNGAADYRIAFVSTDQTNLMERVGTSAVTYATSPPFELISLDVSMCKPSMIQQGCFRGPDAANRVVASSRLDPNMAAVQLQKNAATIGTCGSGIATGLKALSSALAQTDPGGCNAGFLRKEARLVIIFVANLNDADATPIDQYVSDIARFKDYPGIRVGAIVSAEGGESTDCGLMSGAACGKSGCETPAGSHMACMNDMQCPGPSASEPEGETCQPIPLGTMHWCENKALTPTSGLDPRTCGSCIYYNEPDCCSGLAGSIPSIGEPGRYVEYARAMEARIVAADPTIPATQCKGNAGGPAACLVESICQSDYSASLVRMAHALVIGD